jgi:hypothetical protein
MIIELRSLQIQDRQSEETTAFTASLYINGKKIGYAKNSGKGGPTDYGPDNYHDENLKAIIKEAEDYCIGLEPMDLKELGKVPMDMEGFIDQIVSEFWQEKEDKRFKNKMLKDQITGLLIGNDKQYRKITWPNKNSSWTISQLLSTDAGTKLIINTIDNYKKTMSPSERILNTNIPLEIL